MVSAKSLEQQAGQQYHQMLSQAQSQRALGPVEHPQVKRLRAIADRIIPFTYDCNSAARNWKWEVNLIGSKDLNAFCMPGGKIAFYYGILAQLQLNDDEVAMIMGHEIAHALLEHARERMGKSAATNVGTAILSSALGLGRTGDALLRGSAGLLGLKFSRQDESEADALGLNLAARAGYNPRAGVTLWQKMLAASKGAPPQFLSTHPSGETRIQDITARLPVLEPLYEAAPKPTVRFGPPAMVKAAASAPGTTER
jgi:predicted Zn-dependent protease